jgi:hypothetical protein
MDRFAAAKYTFIPPSIKLTSTNTTLALWTTVCLRKPKPFYLFRALLGSNLSIFNRPVRSLAQRRASRISNRQVSNVSLAKSGEKTPEGAEQV